MTFTNTRLLTAAAFAASLAFVAACSGTSPSMSPTAPTASASAASGANFSPNPNCIPPQVLNEAGDACVDPPPPPPTGDDGCTPGYWKANAKKGAGNWLYPTTTTLESVFDVPGTEFDNDTLLDALGYPGGPDVAGATQILLRAAAAALLNAASPGVDYPLSTTQVINLVNLALETADRDTILALATRLDGLNNGGCTLDNNGL